MAGVTSLLVILLVWWQVLGDEDKKAKYDRGEDLDEPQMGGGGFNPFGGGGGGFTFQFEGGFPGGGAFHF